MIRFFWAFLFLALSSLSFANTTFYYYEKNGGGFCSTSVSGICASLTNLNSPSCSLSGTIVVATWTNVILSGDGKTTTTTTSTGNAGIQRSIVCPVGYKMQLSGCTATCVKENKCESKLGQKEQRVAQCGMLTGGNCTSKPTPDAGDTFTKTCDTYKFDWLPLSGKYNLGGCEATVTKQVPLVKNNGNLEPNDVYDGSSNNIPLNCEIELTYNGQEFTDSPTSAPPSAPKSSTTGGSATKPTTDGSSGQPTDTTGGLKPSSNGTSDGVGTDTGGGSGSGTCTITGQTQVNGSCQCPSGQTVQNNQCTSSGGGSGTCTIAGQTQVNGSCQCPTGQTVQNGACSSGGQGSEGSYSGSNKCEQAPACTGDVVQCGLMAEQYKAKCEMLEQLGGVPDDVKQASNSLGEEVTNSQDINGMKQAVTGYMTTLESLVVPSNSSCVISNIQLQILATAIEIPLSQFCPFFELIRLMLNITIDLLVLRIVSRAVLSAG